MTSINIVFVVVQFTLLALLLWGLFRTLRGTTGRPPWPLRFAVDDKGSPRLSFNIVLFGLSVILFVVLLASTPSRFSQRTQQLDRIEHLLIEIRDEVRR